jgi:hypothetical protein
VSKIGTTGAGNDQFNLAEGIATDGTNIWVGDTQNLRIVKRLCSDLSYVSEVAYVEISTILCYGDYLYAVSMDQSGIYKLNKSDMSEVAYIESDGAGDAQFHWPSVKGGY